MELTRRGMLAGAMALANDSLWPAIKPPSPAYPDDVIEAQGDSLTFGHGSSGVLPGQGPYPLQLQSLLTARYGRAIPVNNRGIGGVNARICSALSNGQPMHFTVQGGVIPSAGPVSLINFDATPITQQNAAPLMGTYGGVRGNLVVTKVKPTFDVYSMVFIRERPGPIVPVSPLSPFYTAVGVATRHHIKLMVYGRNGQRLDQIVAAVDGDVAYQDAIHKRWLVGSVMTAVTDIGTPVQTHIAQINGALMTRFHENFVDLDSPPTPAEMKAIGFVPDRDGPYPSQRTDEQDIAAGVLPSGMRMGGTANNQHLNNYGYALWAMRFDRRIAKMGWFTKLLS